MELTLLTVPDCPNAIAVPRPLPGGGTAWVVPSGQVAAWRGGLRHPRWWSPPGLLGLLSPGEQRAVLAHEAAHVRLGHPQILLAGGVIGRCYRWLPPACLAWDRLRRDLEAAADDDEAAAAAGAAPLLSALAKVAFATTAPGAPRLLVPGSPKRRIFATGSAVCRPRQPPAPAAPCRLAWPGRS